MCAVSLSNYVFKLANLSLPSPKFNDPVSCLSGEVASLKLYVYSKSLNWEGTKQCTTHGVFCVNSDLWHVCLNVSLS